MITPEHLKDLRDMIAAISLRDHGVGAPGSRHGVDVITAKWVRNHGVIKVLNVKFFSVYTVHTLVPTSGSPVSPSVVSLFQVYFSGLDTMLLSFCVRE